VSLIRSTLIRQCKELITIQLNKNYFNFVYLKIIIIFVEI
jgi:hypothetical protein